MFKIPDIAGLDLQAIIDKEVMALPAVQQYVESITYLKDDAPCPEHCIKVGAFFRGQEVAVAVDPKGLLVEKVAEVIGRVL